MAVFSYFDTGKGIFQFNAAEGYLIENGEIISTTTTNLYYHYGSTPIPVNVSKQCHSMSDVGKVSTYGVNVADIQCEIQMNGKPFKTLKIANKILYSNRI